LYEIQVKTGYFRLIILLMAIVFEILKYIIPAIIVLICSYLIISKFLVTDLKQKQLKMLQSNQEVTVRLRLQALERLVLFIERIHPRQIVPRIYQSGMTVTDLQQALVFNIRAEFEHNLSQQIYVSKQVWDTVRGVKEQEINMISQIAQQLSPEAPAKELHMRIVDYLLTTEEAVPVEIALQMINDEAKRLLTYGAQA
jgi:hypothetical protein